MNENGGKNTEKRIQCVDWGKSSPQVEEMFFPVKETCFLNIICTLLFETVKNSGSAEVYR
jgi:hypothetical protein